MERDELGEGVQLTGHTTVNFSLAGLLFGLAVFTDSAVFHGFCGLAAITFLWLGYRRPTHASPTHRIKLVTGGVFCVVAGFSVRWFFAVDGIFNRLLIVSLFVAALIVGYFV